jgi:hypothetical protein
LAASEGRPTCNPEQEGKAGKECETSSEVVQTLIRKCPETVSLKSSLDISEELDIFFGTDYFEGSIRFTFYLTKIEQNSCSIWPLL